jgi:hypothetical protein
MASVIATASVSMSPEQSAAASKRSFACPGASSLVTRKRADAIDSELSTRTSNFKRAACARGVASARSTANRS